MSIPNMSNDEAIETIKKLKKILPDIEHFNITTNKKIYHITQLENVRQLLYKCMSIHFVYDPDYNYAFQKYRKNININASKKELDSNLKYCIISLHSDITSHINELQNMIEKTA